ncbi:unnamed protein product [Acidocella sp. C78]|nr:unnamed protein product [Acidocella sp. C78]
MDTGRRHRRPGPATRETGRSGVLRPVFSWQSRGALRGCAPDQNVILTPP